MMNCPLCKSNKTVLFHDKVWSVENRKVYRCKGCDITFIFPVMTDEETLKFYKNYNKHVNARGVTLSEDPKEVHSNSKPAVTERFSIVSRFFTGARRVLEVGSSTGAFLELLGESECYCVEPSDENRKYSEKFVECAYSDIREVEKIEKFDIICMFHVFEHIRDPLCFLELCKIHLNKGGVIIIEVPNVEDPLISLYDCKAFKDFYFQPMHPYIYSLKSLQFVFGRAGLSEKEVIFHQRYGLDNHLTWLSKGKPGRDVYLEMLFSSVTAYKRKLEDEKITDTIFYIVQNERNDRT